LEAHIEVVHLVPGTQLEHIGTRADYAYFTVLDRSALEHAACECYAALQSTP
jgi:hypothetical protein